MAGNISLVLREDYTPQRWPDRERDRHEWKTKQPIAIKDTDKPLDGVFETATETTYYSYHAGYKEAMRQVNAAKAAMLV